MPVSTECVAALLSFRYPSTKTIKQKLQQQQENLYTRRKCILKEMLKGEVSSYYRFQKLFLSECSTV